MSEHARLSPSAATKWTACPGSIAAERGHPDTESEASRRGTAAHELLELRLTGQTVPLDLVMSNCYTLNEEDLGAVRSAEEYIAAREFNPLYSEIKLTIGDVMCRDDTWGTADVIGLDGRMLEVIDYKHGSGIVVEVKSNLQLLLYAIGAVSMFVEANPETQITIVRMTIIQPRADHEDGPIRTEDIPIEDLTDWTAWFAQQAALTDDPNAPRIPGDSQCEWCKARGTCEALAEHSMSKTLAVFDAKTLDVEPDRMLSDPKDLTDEQMRTILDNTKLITGWLKSVNEYALKEATRGGTIAGYKVVAGRKSKSFKQEDEDIEKALRKLKKTDGTKITKKDVTVTKLKSPSQTLAGLKPMLGEKMFEKVKALIKTNDGTPTLAPLTDRRPALPSKVDAAFADIENPKEEEAVDLSFLS